MDLLPHNYTIYRDGLVVKSGLWNSSSESITYDLSGLAVGVYSFTIGQHGFRHRGSNSG
jgi:hypothetical protein